MSRLQNGMVRTNCVDCLDRTNVQHLSCHPCACHVGRHLIFQVFVLLCIALNELLSFGLWQQLTSVDTSLLYRPCRSEDWIFPWLWMFKGNTHGLPCWVRYVTYLLPAFCHLLPGLCFQHGMEETSLFSRWRDSYTLPA